MENKVQQIFNSGPISFSFGRQLLLICKCNFFFKFFFLLGPEYGQGLPLKSG